MFFDGIDDYVQVVKALGVTKVAEWGGRLYKRA